jgi:flavin-dependent dehydrogenase
VELTPSTIRDTEHRGGGWRLRNGDGQAWSVRLLVGADGVASLVRRFASPGFRVDLAPTRVTYPKGPGVTPAAIVVSLRDGGEGYVWELPRVDHRSVGIIVFPGGWNRGKMDLEVQDFHRSRQAGDTRPLACAGAVIGTAWRGHGDYSGVGAANFALLGDAAGFGDSATGEGIENALRSAQLLARSFEKDGDFRSYPTLAKRVLEREFRVSRTIRKVLFGMGVGTHLVRSGSKAKSARHY